MLSIFYLFIVFVILLISHCSWELCLGRLLSHQCVRRIELGRKVPRESCEIFFSPCDGPRWRWGEIDQYGGEEALRLRDGGSYRGALEMTVEHLSEHGSDRKKVLCYTMNKFYHCDAWIDQHNFEPLLKYNTYTCKSKVISSKTLLYFLHGWTFILPKSTVT